MGRRGSIRSAGGRPLVVCLDDEPAVLRALRRSLRREPYEVRTTTDPLEAIGWAETESVSVMLVDQQMSCLGTDVLRAVSEYSSDIGCIMLTGRPDHRVILGRLRGQVQRLLTKPWDDGELKRVLREVLEEVRVRQEQEFQEDLRELLGNGEERQAKSGDPVHP